MPQQTFRIFGPGADLDGAVLAAIECGEDYLATSSLAIVRGGSLLQALDASEARGHGAIVAVALRDVNGDNAADLIAVLSTMTGAGECSSTDLQFPFVALQRAGRFEAVPEALLRIVPQGLDEGCVAPRVTVSGVVRTLAGRL